jgi:hypothetical protein
MTKRLGLIVLFILPSEVWAQEDNFRQIIRTVLYAPEVFNKVFFEYNGDSITFMEGASEKMLGAFIIPDTTMQKRIPNLLHIVGTSHGTEKYFMTITFLSHPNGKVFITSHVMDPAILIYIDLDQYSINGKKAGLEFHTTSFPESKAAKLDHFRVVCELIKRKRSWTIKSLVVKPIDCCTPLW